MVSHRRINTSRRRCCEGPNFGATKSIPPQKRVHEGLGCGMLRVPDAGNSYSFPDSDKYSRFGASGVVADGD